MRSIILALFLMLFISTKAQIMKPLNQPKEVVKQLFIATDNRDWKTVEHVFSDEVILDYSSMGNPKATLKPIEIINAWKTILPGFKYTHHQIGNVQESISKNQAMVFAYGTARHFLEDTDGNIWTVVGTYNFDLKKEKGDWKISAMTFNFKFQEGNLKLAQKAMDIVSGRPSSPSISERNKALVKSFLKALEREDAKAVSQLFAQDGKHINPYHSGIFPKGAEGREAILQYWSPVFPNFDGMEFPIEELYAMENPSKVFVKFKGKIKLKNNAGFYENDYYALFTFNTKGEITEYIELFNPVKAAKSFGLIDQLKN